MDREEIRVYSLRAATVIFSICYTDLEVKIFLIPTISVAIKFILFIFSNHISILKVHYILFLRCVLYTFLHEWIKKLYKMAKVEDTGNVGIAVAHVGI